MRWAGRQTGREIIANTRDWLLLDAGGGVTLPWHLCKTDGLRVPAVQKATLNKQALPQPLPDSLAGDCKSPDGCPGQSEKGAAVQPKKFIQGFKICLHVGDEDSPCLLDSRTGGERGGGEAAGEKIGVGETTTAAPSHNFAVIETEAAFTHAK